MAKSKKMKRRRQSKTPIVEKKGMRGDDDGEEVVFSELFVGKGKILSEGVFDSTVKTKGGMVKEKGAVLETLNRRHRHQANVNCRVESFGKMVASFKEKEKRWVNEMGFGGLLWLKGRGLPRSLCYWIMTIFDPYRKVMNFPGGVEYPISKSQVRWVFGLPHGPKTVPTVVKGLEMATMIEAIERDFGDWVQLKGKLHRVVDVGKARVRLEEEWLDSQEHAFKLAFMIVALGDVLCPTTSTRLSKSLYGAVAVAVSSNVYDWCQLVVDKLVWSAKQFVTKFYQHGYCKGAGGCTYFLAILYLDHLHRTPVDWGVYPRVRVWTTKNVNEARAEDKESGKGDFGKLGCMSVPYGKNHPLMPEDTMGPDSGASNILAVQVANLVLSGMGIDGSAGGLGAGHASYESDGEEELGQPEPKRRRTGRRDGKFFEKEHFDLGCLLGEKPLSSRDDGEWSLSEEEDDGGEDVDDDVSLVDSQEVMSSDEEDEEVGNWNPSSGGETVVTTTTEESVDASGEVNCEGVSVRTEVNIEFNPVSADENSEEEMTYEQLGKVLEEEMTYEQMGKVVEEERALEEEVHDTPQEEGVVHQELGVGGDEGVVHQEEVSQPEGPGLDADRSENEASMVNTKLEEEFDGRRLGVLVGKIYEEAVGYSTPENEVEAEKEVVDNDPPVKVRKSRRRRGRKLSCKVKDKDFETILIPRQHRQMRKKIVNFLNNCPSRSNSLVLLRSGSHEASVLNCRSVLCEAGGVDDNYIRTAANLFTRTWKEKYVGGSIRLMMDPTVAIRLLTEKSDNPDDWISTFRGAKSAAKPYVGECSAQRFFVVFLPVLEKGHWWCVGYCLNSEEIWVIDSASRAPVQEHESVINKLCYVVDKFLTVLDGDWVCGNICSWSRKAVKVQHQEDGFTCGIYMMAAVNKCAERFIEEFAFDEPVDDEKEWLLTTHLMSDFNEARDELKDILGKSVGEDESNSEDDGQT